MKQVFVLLLLATTSVFAQNYTNVSASEFKSLIEKKNGVIADIRTPAEFERGYIPGATLYNSQDPNIGTLLLSIPKTKPVYVYCYSGARSRQIATFLANNGYTQVYNLQRGLIDWNSMGYTLQTPANAAANSAQPHAYTLQKHTQLINKQSLVFIDYYAPWCAPCKQMMPMIDELTAQYKGKILIEKVNTDASKEVMQQLQIKGVPYLVLYKDGKPVYTQYGMVSKEVLQTEFAKYIK
ncbi:MAG TPA: thioredoxin domain-containing protein [Bacteroidales bacterium]|nr:thioredoxin domain-containing protein [Bacteroidales bacterium]HRS19033.1 thioredoxin domain-containing protein [Bacteroidales bacterium]